MNPSNCHSQHPPRTPVLTTSLTSSRPILVPTSISSIHLLFRAFKESFLGKFPTGLPLPFPSFACHAHSFASHLREVANSSHHMKVGAKRTLVQRSRSGPNLRPKTSIGSPP